MKNDNRGDGQDHSVDFLIAALSIGVLLLGVVMVAITWRGTEGPNLQSVMLLVAGAILFAGHNICLYVADCSTDTAQALTELREALAKQQQESTKDTEDKPTG